MTTRLTNNSTHGQVDSRTSRLIDNSTYCNKTRAWYFFFFLNLFIYFFKSLYLIFSCTEESVESSRRNKRVTQHFHPGPGFHQANDSKSAVFDHTDVLEWRYQSNLIIFVDCSFWPCWPEDVKGHYYFTLYFTDFVLVNFLLLSIRPINNYFEQWHYHNYSIIGRGP